MNGRWRWTQVVFSALFGIAGVHCDDDEGHSCRSGEPCPCLNPERCVLDCSDIDNCIPLCGGTNFCHVRCGDHCEYECRSMGDCDATTGTESSVTCSDTSACVVRVGPGSTVDCSNLNVCDVTCAGPCEVSAVSVTATATTITCLSSAAGAVQCSDTRWVCDGSC